MVLLQFIFLGLIFVRTFSAPIVEKPISDIVSNMSGDAYEFTIPRNTFTDSIYFSVNVNEKPDWLTKTSKPYGFSDLVDSLAVNSGDPYFIQNDGDTVYMTLNDGFMVIDARAKSTLVNLGEQFTYGYYGIYVDDDYAYLPSGNSFVILDVTDPTNQKVVSSYSAVSGEDWTAVSIRDNYAFIGESNSNRAGLNILDISNKSEPVFVANSTSFVCWYIEISGDYAYLAAESDLYVYDISDLTDPSLVFEWRERPNHDIEYLALYENYLFVEDYAHGLYIFDITVGGNPSLVGNYTIKTSAYSVSVDSTGNYIYVSTFYDGIYLLDITDKSNPMMINKTGSSGYLYISNVDDGYYIYAGDNSVDYAIHVFGINKDIILEGTCPEKGEHTIIVSARNADDIETTDTFTLTCQCSNEDLCQNGGEMDSVCDQCINCEGNWGGEYCNVCGLDCNLGDQSLDCSSCFCPDGAEYTDDCQLVDDAVKFFGSFFIVIVSLLML